MKQTLTLLIALTVVALMSGVAQASPTSVPDAGTTSSLMILALGGLTVLRRFVR